MDGPGPPAPVETLLENHRVFLRYLERRVGDRALAEDILQDAFAKVVARPEPAPADQAIVPWFYRALRNAAAATEQATHRTPGAPPTTRTTPPTASCPPRN